MFRIYRFTLLPLVLITGYALALCGRPQPRLLRAEYSQSDAVVIAYLLKSKHVEPRNDQDYHLYTFHVEKTLRGNIPDQFVLWDENSSARVTFVVRSGRKYLLFLHRSPDKSNDWWVADGCGHSGEVSENQNTIKQIERIPSMRGGQIIGRVTTDLLVVENAEVIALSKTTFTHFRTKTNNSGSFTLEVPAGASGHVTW